MDLIESTIVSTPKNNQKANEVSYYCKCSVDQQDDRSYFREVKKSLADELKRENFGKDSKEGLLFGMDWINPIDSLMSIITSTHTNQDKSNKSNPRALPSLPSLPWLFLSLLCTYTYSAVFCGHFA